MRSQIGDDIREHYYYEPLFIAGAKTLAALLAERDALKAERDAERARAEAAEAEVARLRERIAAAAELAETTFHNPQGTLWNYGTTPTARDRAKWEGVRETAQEILGVLDPGRAYAAALTLTAATERMKERK